MKTKKYWLKPDPRVVAEVFDVTPDDLGGVPALVTQTNEEGVEQTLYALIRLEEWTDVEIQMAPEDTVSAGYLVLYRNDGALTYLFVTTEDAARQSLTYDKAIGYVPVSVDTLHMTVKDAPPAPTISGTLDA